MIIFSVTAAADDAPAHAALPAYDSAFWHLLVHYRPYKGGYKSAVNEPAFFLSESGPGDPRAEYEAAKRIFLTEKNAAAINRFPLRYRFVCKSEGVEPDESLYSEDVARISVFAKNTKRSFLVFASDYKSKPESMFGHTFLCFDAGDSDCLALCVSYAADAGGAGRLEYFYKGVSGGFTGKYTSRPYFYKIKEYNYRDGRDLWEYGLNLNSDEVRTLLEHIYELQTSGQGGEPYYFFSENCSYAIIYLLALARPHSEILDTFPAWVVPLDTVKAARKSGFHGESFYRPSAQAKVEALAAPLSRKDFERGRKISRDVSEAKALIESAGPGAENKSRILDFALEYYNYREYPKLNTPDSNRKEEFEKGAIEIARYRSRTGIVSAPLPLRPEDPLRAHRPMRVQSGAGMEGKRSYALLSARLTYHAGDDPLYSFAPANELVGPELSLKLYDPGEKRDLSLESLTIARIASINRVSRLHAPVSWRISAALMRDRPFDNALGFSLSAESGLAAGSRDAVFYTLGGFRMKAGEHFYLPLTMSGGAVIRLCDAIHVYSETVYNLHYLQERHTLLAKGGATAGFGQGLAFSCELSRSLLYVKQNTFDLKAGFYF